MRVVFAGTSEFAVPSLSAILSSSLAELIAVYTQPDRPAGRGRKVREGVVKMLASKFGVPVFQPEALYPAKEKELLRRAEPDLIIVVSYGAILPKDYLSIPPLGCINLHASLLPKWRGAAPIQRAIEAGDKTTGVTLMQMEEGLDTGPILVTREIKIMPDETGGSLHDRLSRLAGELLSCSLAELKSANLVPVRQDDTLATYAAKLSKPECQIDWQRPAFEIEKKIRAYNPWPGTTAQLQGKTIRVWKARCVAGENPAIPGKILAADQQGIVVSTGDGAIQIEQLQKPGGRIMGAAEFLNGYPIGADGEMEISTRRTLCT